jgi:outer membrane protein OmpA-like peptidoglycan-associated protein
LAKVGESVAEDFRVALLSGARICTRRALWQSILVDLGKPYRGIDEAELRIAVAEVVRELAVKGSGLVILVDEAHTPAAERTWRRRYQPSASFLSLHLGVKAAAIPPGTNANIPAGGLAPGSSVLLVNGVASSVTIKPDQPVQPKSLVATGDGFTMEIAGQDASGKSLGLTSDAALLLQRDNTAMVKGSGFAPNVDVQVNIFSTATLLGTIRTDATGAFNGTVRVPATIEPGRHTLQVAALTADNKVRSLSLGVVLEAPAKAVRTAKATVTFDSLSSTLTPKAKKALRSLAKKTKATATGGLAVGYVQRDGNPANNASLSRKRASEIVRFLKANGVMAPLGSRGNGAWTKQTNGRIANVSVSYTY